MLAEHPDVAEHADKAGQLGGSWEEGAVFVRLEADRLVAGSAVGSFPGGDVAGSWPLASLTPSKIRRALAVVNTAIVDEVVMTMRMRRALGR